MAMPLEDKFVTHFPQLVRSAWKPEKATTPSENWRASRFGGKRPFRRTNFRWPRCEECNHQKCLLVQLDVFTLPQEAQELSGLKEGLLQVFYCLSCTPFRDVFSDLWVVPPTELVPSLQCLAASTIMAAGIPLGGLPTKLKDAVEGYTEQFDSAKCQGLEEVEVAAWRHLGKEIPSMTELREEAEALEQAGITEEALEKQCDSNDSKIGHLHWHIPNVKLGGWVRWCQDIEYPVCSRCNVEMRLPLLQMEQTVGMLDYMWGDSGTAHITLCPTCHRLGLGWACC